MKKIIVLVFLFFVSPNICFSQNPNLTKMIKIYDPDSASVWKFYKTKLPQAGYKNLYIQLSGVYQGYNVDLRHGNIYRLNYQTNIFSDMYHNGFLHNSYDLIPPYGILIGYAYDFNISPLDTNLLIKGGCAAWWEPMEGVTLTLSNGDSGRIVFPNAFQANFLTVAIDPTNDSIMYAGLKSGIIQENFYKTTNRGTNWFATDTLINYTKSRTYVNPFNHNIVFLMNSSLYRSTTGGYDFSVLTTGTSYDGRMLFDAYDNSIYLISPTTEGIRKSTNNGNTWSQVFNKPCNDLEIDPLNNNIFYAGTGEGIYKSTNKGSTWFLYNNTFTPSKNVIGLLKNPNTADTLYAVTGKGVYKVFGQAVLDTASAKYFPLHVGNVYSYYWYEIGPYGSSGYFKARITKDTMMNGFKYFYLNNFPGINNIWARYDSIRSNLLAYSPNSNCSGYINDKIIDSLKMLPNDQITSCIYNFTLLRCEDTTTMTLFNSIPVSTKSFRHDGLVLAFTRYAKNFGIVSYSMGEPPPVTYFVSIRGCKINGVVYGDTNIFYNISGFVRYTDNNQPVTSGWVKAIKLDKNTANIIVVDSAAIQSNGSYTLTKVPQDSVDIGIYPNSTPPNDWVITYYPSTTYWEHATTLYPTGNLTNINIGAIRMSPATNNNSVNGKVMRLNDNPLGNLKDAVLYAKNGNTFVRCTMSDGNGVYHLNSLPTGNLKIIVNRLGFTGDSTTVNVTTTSNIDSINFYLYKVPVGIKQISSTVPSEYKLYQNYPNPFNPSTIIKYTIAENRKLKTENGLVTLKIYDILGKEIVTLVNEKQAPGIYEVTWDARHGGSSTFPSGIYFYKLVTEGFIETKKMVLLK